MFVLLAATSLSAVNVAAQAQPTDARPKAGFSDAEREAIREYFTAHTQQVKPLPPGIAKNLQRGKSLPPGIAKQRLPEALAEQLPPREPEAKMEVAIFGDRIVLLEASGIVVDIIADVFK
jgi:hypothetical protein